MGWTQRELAERAKVSVRTVREVERGRTTRRGAASARLAEALGLDVTDSGGLRIDVLGPLVVRVEDVPLDLRAEKQRSLLGLLALHAGEVVSRDRIVDVLWTGRPPPSWRNLVHTYVTRLRVALSRNAIVNAHNGYHLSVDARLDFADFDAGTTTARRHLESGDLAAAERELGRVLGLWRGPVLDDLPDRVKSDPVTSAITRRRTTAALAHADVALTRGRFGHAVTSLWPVVHDQPLHESLHAKLIVALAGDGQQAAALALFSRIRSRLADELGVHPSAELRDAHLRVLRQELSGLPAFTPRKAAG